MGAQTGQEGTDCTWGWGATENWPAGPCFHSIGYASSPFLSNTYTQLYSSETIQQHMNMHTTSKSICGLKEALFCIRKVVSPSRPYEQPTEAVVQGFHTGLGKDLSSLPRTPLLVLGNKAVLLSLRLSWQALPQSCAEMIGRSIAAQAHLGVGVLRPAHSPLSKKSI